MAKLSYKERARQQREQDILRTAARMIRDNGYVNLNMDDLAEEVGISKPTLYQHFKGKDDMVEKAMLHSMRQLEAFIESIVYQPPVDQLVGIMRYMLDQHTDPEGFSVTIMRDGAHGLRHLTDTPTPMQKTQRIVSQRINDLVNQAKENGTIRPEIPNVVIIGMMFSSLTILQGPAIMRDYSDATENVIDCTLAFWQRGALVNPPMD
jgi:TetR/AcrR family transcriptional regulator